MTAPLPGAFPALELLIVLPLAASLLAILLGGRLAPRIVLLLGPAMLVVTAVLAFQIQTQGPVRVEIGGWEAPLGIALIGDGLAGVFLVLTAIVMTAVGVFAQKPFGSEGAETTESYTFWPLYFAMWAALNAVFCGGDLFNLYVALELLTLTAVAMVAYGSTRAALRYLLFALAGSLAYLMGIVLLYSATGTLDIELLARQDTIEATRMVSGALMTAGLLAKTALFPLHGWLPPAHGSAPAPASALLSSLVIKASFVIIVRIWFDVMPDVAGTVFVQLLSILGAGAVLYGSLLALRQTRLKMIIAYSTVAQLGYLFFIFPLAGGAAAETPWAAGAWSGGMFHALAHGLAKAAMFLAAGLVIEALGHDRIDDIKGIARALPLTMFAFGLAAVSLMGLPPSGGFLAKYLMLTAALADGQIGLALVMLAGGLLAAAYLFRPVNRALAGDYVPEVAVVTYWRQLIPLGLALLSVALGIISEPPYDLLQVGRSKVAVEGIDD